MSRTLPLLALAAALASATCALPNVFAPQNPVDFCIEQAKVYCALEFRCCSATERSVDPLHIFKGPTAQRWAPSNEDECVGLASDVCRGVADQLNESLQKERVKYSADEATSCLTELHKSVDACDLEGFLKDDGTWFVSLLQAGQPGVFGTACEDAVKGAVDTHDTCFATYECKTGNCTVNAAPNEVTQKGECDGTDRPENPFSQANISVQICEGSSNGG